MLRKALSGLFHRIIEVQEFMAGMQCKGVTLISPFTLPTVPDLYPGYIYETVRCRKLIVGKDNDYGCRCEHHGMI